MRSVFTLTCLGVLIAGCSPQPIVTTPASPASNTTPAGSTVPTTDVVGPSTESGSGAKLQREAGEAWDAAGEFAAESKDEFVAEAKRRLAIMDAKLEEWKVQASKMSAEAKEEWEPRRVQLEERRDELQKELDRLMTSSAGAWEEVKVGAAKAWKETSDAFRKAADHFQ